MKKIKVFGMLLIIIIVCNSSLNIFASLDENNLKPEWVKHKGTKTGYYSSVGHESIKSYDNTTLVCGSENSNGIIINYHENGTEIWKKSYTTGQIKAVIKDGNNGYVAVGNRSMLFLDSLGNQLDVKHFDITAINNVSKTSNDNYLLIGSIGYNYSAITRLLKVDSSGNLLWSKDYKYSTHSRESYGESAKEIPGQGYIVTGTTTGTRGFMHVFATDYDGNLIWDKIFDEYTSQVYANAEEVIVLDDGNFVVSGYDGFLEESVRCSTLVKMSFDGSIIWQKNYTKTGTHSKAQDVIYVKDKGFVIADKINIDGVDYAYLIETDIDGNEIGTTVLNDYPNTNFYSVTEAIDGNYIATGIDNNTNAYKMIIVKFTKNTPQDNTPPEITGSVINLHNEYNWYNSNVTVHFDASDDDSGLESVTEDQILMEEKENNSVTGFATDKAGNTSETTVSGINIDKTKPIITLNIQDKTEFLLNENIEIDYQVIDELSGIDLVNSSVINGSLLDTSSIGEKQIEISGIDKAGNEKIFKITYYVKYMFNGFLSPLKSTKEYKLGSAIPIKFSLVDNNKKEVGTATAGLFLVKVENGVVTNEIQAVSKEKSTNGNLFKYDEENMLYKFNLDTKTLSSGQWQLIVKLDDGSLYKYDINIKK